MKLNSFHSIGALHCGPVCYTAVLAGDSLVTSPGLRSGCYDVASPVASCASSDLPMLLLLDCVASVGLTSLTRPTSLHTGHGAALLPCCPHHTTPRHGPAASWRHHVQSWTGDGGAPQYQARDGSTAQLADNSTARGLRDNKTTPLGYTARAYYLQHCSQH